MVSSLSIFLQSAAAVLHPKNGDIIEDIKDLSVAEPQSLASWARCSHEEIVRSQIVAIPARVVSLAGENDEFLPFFEIKKSQLFFRSLPSISGYTLK